MRATVAWLTAALAGSMATFALAGPVTTRPDPDLPPDRELLARIEALPDNTWLRLPAARIMGDLAWLKGDLAQAERYFKAAVEASQVAEDTRELWRALADLYSAEGRWAEVERVAREWLGARPSDPGAHWYLAYALDRTGAMEEARKVLEEAARPPDLLVRWGDLARVRAGLQALRRGQSLERRPLPWEGQFMPPWMTLTPEVARSWKHRPR